MVEKSRSPLQNPKYNNTLLLMNSFKYHHIEKRYKNKHIIKDVSKKFLIKHCFLNEI